jgi:hypothetical protein
MALIGVMIVEPIDNKGSLNIWLCILELDYILFWYVS